MAVETTAKEYSRLDGGLNSLSAPTALNPGEFFSVTNMMPTDDGAVYVRGGFTTVATDSGTKIGTGLFQYIPLSGSMETLKTAKNDGAWTTSHLKVRTGATWSTVTQAPLGLFKNHDYCTFIQVNNVVYIFAFGGTNRMMKYDGAQMTEVASAPLCQGGIYYYDRVWVWGNSSSPHSIYVSATGSYENFTTGDSFTIDVTPGDGDVIAGLGALFNRLVVFKRRNVFTIDGNDYDSFSLLPVVSDGGCLSARSVLSIENRLLYLSDKGVYQTDGSTCSLLSEYIRPTRDALNRARDKYSFALHNRYRSQYMLTVSGTGSSTNDSALVYRYASSTADVQAPPRASWWPFETWPYNAGAVIINATNQERLYFLDYLGNLKIYEWNESGENITINDGGWNGMGLWHDHEAPHRSKLWRRLIVYFTTTDGAGKHGYVAQANIGVEPSEYLLLSISGVAQGIQFELFTDFDAAVSSVRQTMVFANPDAQTALVGIQKYVIEAQVLGPRMPQV